MDWKEAIRQWRALSAEEKQRRRLKCIPRKAARSLVLEVEAMDLTPMDAEHPCRLMSWVHSQPGAKP